MYVIAYLYMYDIAFSLPKVGKFCVHARAQNQNFSPVLLIKHSNKFGSISVCMDVCRTACFEASSYGILILNIFEPYNWRYILHRVSICISHIIMNTGFYNIISKSWLNIPGSMEYSPLVAEDNEGAFYVLGALDVGQMLDDHQKDPTFCAR